MNRSQGRRLKIKQVRKKNKQRHRNSDSILASYTSLIQSFLSAMLIGNIYDK